MGFNCVTASPVRSDHDVGRIQITRTLLTQGVKPHNGIQVGCHYPGTEHLNTTCKRGLEDL